MPLMSTFFGVLIYMFKEKNSPHQMPYRPRLMKMVKS
ncbi:MAG: hypothetical protein Ta2A_15240 [Treponemataceae bacterium]|nr:MAG: hypothetical protein Ta2A_15240 [Treponemataceae bacterium]